MIPQVGCTDFPKICRLCMKEGPLINILNRTDLIHVYINITNITIKENDRFPKNTCHDCVQKLEDIQHFIQMCKHTHDCLTAAILHQGDREILNDNLKNDNSNTVCDKVYDNENNSDVDQEDCESIVLDDLKLESNVNLINSKTERQNMKDCKKCKRKFRSNNLFKIHMSNHCRKLNKTKTSFKTESKLNLCTSQLDSNEIIFNSKCKFKNRVKKWRCFECNKEFTKKNDLQRHLRIHTGSRPFMCSLCDLKFTQKSTLNRHISAIHIIDQKQKYNFECYICEKKFNRKDHLECHIINCHIRKINEQSLDNPVLKSCEDCGRLFSLFSYIRHHKVVHTFKEGKEPKIKNTKIKLPSSSSNLCSVCGKAFEKRATYLQHMRRSHGPPLPKKPKEGKPSSNDKETSKYRFQCWQCGKIKSTLCNLKVHMRIHTGEKPYQCKFCFRKFSAWNSWHDHENIHLGLKPYQCDHCKKVFRQRSSLRKHLRSSVHVIQHKPDKE